MQHISTITKSSAVCTGVSYSIKRMTFGRRLELIRRAGDLAKRLEFHSAGTSFEDQAERGILTGEINKLYLNWALIEVRGLEIDGVPAKPETLIDDGPEELCQEIIEAVKAECFLTGEERKN